MYACGDMTPSRIDDVFADLRATKRKAIIPFVCGGSPVADNGPDAVGSTGQLIRALDESGANIIEVGIPFSDPIADGPVIAAAMHRALGEGATPGGVFQSVAAVRSSVKAGLVAMISMSLVHRMGAGRGASIAIGFVSLTKEAGFDGLIVPDCPLEASGELAAAAASMGLSYIQLISPTTPAARVAEIAKASSGFIYAMSRVGITGMQATLPDIGPLVARIRNVTELPIAVGFGVSTAAHVRAVHAHADGAILGSALVKRLTAAAAEGGDVVQAARDFFRELVEG